MDYDTEIQYADVAGSWLIIAMVESSLSSAENQSFLRYGPSAEISPLTVTAGGSGSVTQTNDIRIKIATTTIDMRWLTSDLTASYSGSASGKANTTVSYDGNDTLVIDVTADFLPNDTLIVSGLSFTAFNAECNTARVLMLYLGGAGDTGMDALDTRTKSIYRGIPYTIEGDVRFEGGITFE
jgi:hypothetical protein